MTITIEYDSTALQRAIARTKKTLANPKPFLEDVGEYLLITFRRRYDLGKGPDGRYWPALAASTKAAKKNPKKLVETGQMFHSLSYEANFKEMTIGFADKKYRWHHFGTEPYRIQAKNGRALAFIGSNGQTIVRRSVNHPGIPARPVLGISNADTKEIVTIYKEHIKEAWEGKGKTK